MHRREAESRSELAGVFCAVGWDRVEFVGCGGVGCGKSGEGCRADIFESYGCVHQNGTGFRTRHICKFVIAGLLMVRCA